jgi:hypothetical protein
MATHVRSLRSVLRDLARAQDYIALVLWEPGPLTPEQLAVVRDLEQRIRKAQALIKAEL